MAVPPTDFSASAQRRASYALAMKAGPVRTTIIVTVFTMLASCAMTAVAVHWWILKNTGSSPSSSEIWTWALSIAAAVPALLAPPIVWIMMDILKHLEHALLAVDRVAREDPLTGLLNRRSFMQEARSQLAQAVAAGRPVSLLMADIDDFKRINDTLGHLAGDAVLMRVGAMCCEVLPATALTARFGGEEFVVLLPGYTLARAVQTAETLRMGFEARPLSGGSARLPVRTSVGVASSEQIGHDLWALLRLADQRLYAAKHAGKNRIQADGEGAALQPPRDPAQATIAASPPAR